MLNIVLPIAGRGSRFLAAGYREPKPLIPVFGMPMIALVIRNLCPSCEHQFTFLVLREHLDRTAVRSVLESEAPGCLIVPVEQVTEGAACTVLLARERIDDDCPLMIANTDQFVDIDIDCYLAAGTGEGIDGLIMTFTADDPKWSYVRMNEQALVTEVAEKQVISNSATVGIYNFASGRDFVRAAQAMIDADRRVNGEFYVAPVYNELIASGARIRIHDIGREDQGMYGLGIPEDLDRFLRRAPENFKHLPYYFPRRMRADG